MIDMTFATIEDDEQRNELVALYLKYKSCLYAIAFANLHDVVNAEDAVQEVFSKIADKPEIFFEVSSSKRPAYLRSMVKRISASMFNRKSNDPTESIEELGDEIRDYSITLENELFSKMVCDEVVQFINELPAMQRNTLIFHCLYDMSIDETAQKLNVSLSAANKHLMLARKAVRTFIEEGERTYE